VSFDTSVVGATGGALSSNDSPFPSNIATNVLVGGTYKRLIDGGNANTCDNPVISQVTCNYKNPRLIAWRQPPTFNGPGPKGNLVMAQYNCDGPACNNDAVQLKRGLEFDEDAIDSNSDLIMLGHDTVEGDHGEKVIGTGGIPSNNKKQDNRNRLAIRAQRTSWGGILLACERGSLGGQKIYWPNVISYPDPVGNVLEGAMVRYEWYGGTTDADRCGGLWDAAMPWGSTTPPDLTAACCQPGGVGCSNLLASQCSVPNHAQLDGQTCEQLVEHGNENSPPNPGCDLFCSTPNYADANGDGHVDMNDFAFFQRCYSGSGHAVPALPYCLCFDRGSDSPGDNDIDQFDFASFVACAGRAGTTPPNCP